MKTITFDLFKEKLKDNIIGQRNVHDLRVYVLSRHPNAFEAMAISISNGAPWQDNLVEMREGIEDIIDKWDIRMVGKLFELFPDEIFPSIIPNKYKGKKYCLVYNDWGDWCIIFD